MPSGTVNLGKIKTAVEQNRLVMEPIRLNRNVLLEKLGLRFFGQNGKPDQPLPALTTFIKTTQRELVGQNPQVIVTTKVRDYRPFARTFQVGMNEQLQRMGYYLTVRRIVFDALTSFGVGRTGIAITPTQDGWQHELEEPFIDRIDPDDFVVDMSVKTLQQASFIGHWYTVPFEWFERSELFDNKAGLSPDPIQYTTEQGVYRSEWLNKNVRTDQLSVDERISLLDLYLPTSGKLLTVANNHDKTGFVLVREEDWSGPANGPYRVMTLGLETPMGPLPIPPCADIMDLHEVLNFLANKVVSQALAQKRLYAVQQGGDEDAKRLAEAGDGDFVGVSQVGDIFKDVSIGGSDQGTFALMLQMKQLFSYYGGNLDARAGLAAQAGTLGQEELVAASASKLVDSMGEDVTNFMRESVRDLAWYMLHSENKTIVAQEEFGVEFLGEISPDSIVGEFSDYMLDIAPFSMKSRTPEQRAAMLEQMFTTILMPLMPQLQQMGESVDVAKFVRILGDLRGVTELDEIMVKSEATQLADEADPARKPPVTKRTYERVNKAGANTSQAEQALASTLMGAAKQPKEMNAAARGMGA